MGGSRQGPKLGFAQWLGLGGGGVDEGVGVGKVGGMGSEGMVVGAWGGVQALFSSVRPPQAPRRYAEGSGAQQRRTWGPVPFRCQTRSNGTSACVPS